MVRYTVSRSSAAAERSHPKSYDRNTDIRLHSSSEFANRISQSIKNHTVERSKICMVMSAYNEELVLQHTIESAVNAGLSPSDIYVVDDCSADSTATIARRVIGKYNVLTVGRSGKGLALSTVVKELQLTKRYDWIHIADADGEFDENYFSALYDGLDPKYAAATGYMESLPGSYIGNFRVFEYTFAMEITKRYQSFLNLITVIPGPTSIFRSDVFEQLNFTTGVMCEDYDATLQIHEKKLGRIKYIATAIARTQDPHDFKNYVKQVMRWNRGYMQLFVRNKIWRRPSKINMFISYQVAQNLAFTVIYFIFLPLVALLTQSMYVIAAAFLSDLIVMGAIVVISSLKAGRPDALASFPMTYGLRWMQLFLFIRALIEVVVLRKYRTTGGTWDTVVRVAQ